jgi:hypothetical protein
MNDGGEALSRVLVDSLPDEENGAASRVHQDASDILELLEVLDGDPKGGEEHHVGGLYRGKVEPPTRIGIKEANPHVSHALVHMGIVNDLTDKKYCLIWKFLSSLVGIVDGPVHAITEAELLGQAHRDVSKGSPITMSADFFHHGGVILRLDHGAYLVLEAESPAKVGLFDGHGGGCRSFGGEVRVLREYSAWLD